MEKETLFLIVSVSEIPSLHPVGSYSTLRVLPKWPCFILGSLAFVTVGSITACTKETKNVTLIANLKSIVSQSINSQISIAQVECIRVKGGCLLSLLQK